MQTKLAARAQKLSRRIYASLPFSFRFGALMEILSDSYAQMKDAIGRSFYAEFIKAGVPMPPISGKPAEEYLSKVISTGGDALPRGYGGKFGNAVMGMIRSKIPNESDTEDFAQDLWEMLQKKRLKIDKNKADSLKSAESFALKFVDWRIKDWMRTRKKRQEDLPEQSMTEAETGGQQDVEDMTGNDLRQIFNRMRPGEGRKLVQELRRVDPKFPNRAEQWLVAKMEDWSGVEIAEEWGTTGGRVTQWTTKYLPKMQRIFEKYFWAAAV